MGLIEGTDLELVRGRGERKVESEAAGVGGWWASLGKRLALRIEKVS